MKSSQKYKLFLTYANFFAFFFVFSVILSKKITFAGDGAAVRWGRDRRRGCEHPRHPTDSKRGGVLAR